MSTAHNPAIAAAIREREAPKRTAADRSVTRIVVSSQPINVDRLLLGFATLEPYKLIPLVRATRYLRGYGKQGVAVTYANVDEMIMNSKEVIIYPGDVAQRLVGAFKRKGVVEIEELRGCEDWEELATIEEILYPASLHINERGHEDNQFTRITEHLQSVVAEYGEDSRIGRIAKACIESNELGRAGRLDFFRDTQRMNPGMNVPISELENRWRRQLAQELPDNFQLAGSLPGDKDYFGAKQAGAGMSPELEKALISMANRGDSSVQALVESQVQARLDDFKAQLLKELAESKAAPEPKKAK